MQYILPNNIEKQRQLRGTSPKELYIPFNTGRRTGIKDNNDRDSLFTTRPSIDKLKLTEWINSRITDGSIELSSTGLQGTGVSPRLALWNTSDTLTDTYRLRFYTPNNSSRLYVSAGVNEFVSISAVSRGGANAASQLALNPQASGGNYETAEPSLNAFFSSTLTNFSSNYGNGLLAGVTSLCTNGTRPISIHAGYETNFSVGLYMEPQYGTMAYGFLKRNSEFFGGLDCEKLSAGIILPQGSASFRPSYQDGGAKQGTIRYNSETRNIELYRRHGAGFVDGDYSWHQVVTTPSYPTANQQILTSATIDGQYVWVTRAAARAINQTASTNGSGEFTVNISALGLSTDGYVVNITNRSATTPYFINVIAKTSSGFTVKIFNTSGTTVNNTAITFDYELTQT